MEVRECLVRRKKKTNVGCLVLFTALSSAPPRRLRQRAAVIVRAASDDARRTPARGGP